ncbi:MAG: DMT family transporter [Alphaproteobacteria bacterium]|nr:DMT family transporter [Alphaproteobacteria bacterium]
MTTDRSTTPGGVLATAAGSYALLSFAILCWGGNFVVGRFANLDMPPIALSFWRHAVAAALVLPFVVPALRRDWAVLRTRLGLFAVLIFLFVAGNTLAYFSVLHTSITNAALINAGVPVAAVFFSWIILDDRVNRFQAAGIALAALGIVVVVTKADLGLLLRLAYGWGDLFMLICVVAWALYMVLLKRAQIRISPWTLLFVLSAGGAAWLVPAYVVEMTIHATRWSALSFLSLLYVALVSTVLAWWCWNAGTLAIGPNRAAAFMCLHPIFGAGLGMLFFDEALRPYHVVGTILVLAGIVLVSRVYARPATV